MIASNVAKLYVRCLTVISAKRKPVVSMFTPQFSY